MYKPVSKGAQALALLVPLIQDNWPKMPPMVKAMLLQRDKVIEMLDTDPAIKGVLEKWIDQLSKAQIL